MGNKELLEMAKRANSAEEFLALAKENDLEFTQDQAEVYFEQINNSGELSDDDLQNVSGGYDIPRIISPYSYCCKSYVCAHCGKQGGNHHLCYTGWIKNCCLSCHFCSTGKDAVENKSEAVESEAEAVESTPTGWCELMFPDLL